jgi:predicted transcriptional regulator
VTEHWDRTLDVLLDLDGQVLVVDPEGGYWVRFVVTQVPVSPEKPHGIDYSLTLHGPDGERLVGFDNAHPSAKQRRREPQNHRHRQRKTRAYKYRDAATLLADFWADGGCGVAREGSDPMTTLKVGIASYEEMKARTIAVARGERRIKANEPKVWFTSTESFAKVLSAGNRELLRIIADKSPASLDELARVTGKAKSNLSRTLKTMERYGLVRLERGEHGRITPKVIHNRVELDLPLTPSRKAG